jgi:glycosyltransferase involved in cell wall biosynthesis
VKVLILHRKDVTNPEVGGGTLYTHRIASHLVEKGHEVTLICANYPGGNREDNIDGVNVLRLGTKYSTHLLAPIQYVMKYRTKTDVLIDVVNGPPWFSPLYSKVPKIAVIFQPFTGVFFLELSKPLASMMCIVERIYPYIYCNMPVVTLSPSVRNELVKKGISKENIFVIPPGIDLEKHTSGRKSAVPLILYVGRLKKYKGIDHLIMSMREIRKKVRDARLLIVGKGDYMSELTGLTETVGLKDAVEFCGYVSEEKKIELLKKAHVLVIPSIEEGWGIPIIEAAACGTPAIGTNTSGLRDSIIDEKTGLLVPYGKPNTLAKKIVRVLENDDLRRRLSSNAMEWAKNFDWEKRLWTFERIVAAIGNGQMAAREAL